LFKEFLNFERLRALGGAALVIFLATFALIVLWTLTRSRREVSRWSRIPLDDSQASGQDGPTEKKA